MSINKILISISLVSRSERTLEDEIVLSRDETATNLRPYWAQTDGAQKGPRVH